MVLQMLNDTVRLFFTIQFTIETNTFTVDILNDAEWY